MKRGEAGPAWPNRFSQRIDLDERCAKMCALSLIFRAMSGDVYCGDSLRAEMRTVWLARGGWFQVQDIPEAPGRIKQYAAEQGSLF
jgi:hypothetical protein